MSNYVQSTFFAPKDALLSGNPAKLIRGADIDPELAAIATAIATKLDSSQAGNPTANIGLAAINGVAATYMRSDGAPALSQSIVPTWSGIHTFSAGIAGPLGVATGTPAGQFSVASLDANFAGGQATWTNKWSVFGPNSSSTTGAALGVGYDVTGDTAYLISLKPGTAWKPLVISSSNISWLPSGGTSIDLGYRDMPVNNVSGGYTLALTDRGKLVIVGSGNVTIPANASINFPLGTVLTVFNNNVSAMSISITTDTLVIAGTATTGTRTLASNGMATLVKFLATEWAIVGPGVS